MGNSDSTTHLDHVRNLLPADDEAFWDLNAPDADGSTKALVESLCSESKGSDRKRVVLQLVRDMQSDQRRKISDLSHRFTVHRIENHLNTVNGRLGKQEQRCDDVLSGEATGCRHLVNLERDAWRGLAVAMGVPILLMIIGGILAMVYFKGGK